MRPNNWRLNQAMNMARKFAILVALTIWSACWWAVSEGLAQTTESKNVATGERVSFSRDIRPILSDTCFKCHGPDSNTREADLRLDSRDNVFDQTEVVVPGDIEESELYQRLITEDHGMVWTS